MYLLHNATLSHFQLTCICSRVTNCCLHSWEITVGITWYFFWRSLFHFSASQDAPGAAQVYETASWTTLQVEEGLMTRECKTQKQCVWKCFFNQSLRRASMCLATNLKLRFKEIFHISLLLPLPCLCRGSPNKTKRKLNHVINFFRKAAGKSAVWNESWQVPFVNCLTSSS